MKRKTAFSPPQSAVMVVMVGLAGVAFALAWFGDGVVSAQEGAAMVEPPMGLPPAPMPADNPQTPQKIALGDKLFHDTRFSSTGEVSCATCHAAEKAFTDSPLSVSEGINKLTGTRNAPTVVNSVYFEKRAQAAISRFVKLGYGNLPICIAKTQASISDNPKMLGAPKGWTLTVTDAALSAGAGFLVIICGNMMLMPGLPQVPAAVNVSVNEKGQIEGLF